MKLDLCKLRFDHSIQPSVNSNVSQTRTIHSEKREPPNPPTRVQSIRNERPPQFMQPRETVGRKQYTEKIIV